MQNFIIPALEWAWAAVYRAIIIPASYVLLCVCSIALGLAAVAAIIVASLWSFTAAAGMVRGDATGPRPDAEIIGMMAAGLVGGTLMGLVRMASRTPA